MDLQHPFPDQPHQVLSASQLSNQPSAFTSSPVLSTASPSFDNLSASYVLSSIDSGFFASSTRMSQFDLVIAAVQAICQVAVIILAGFLLSRAGFIDYKNQKWLSKLNMHFFTPCLLFTKMASQITFAKFIALWPIPAFYAIFAVLAFLLSRLGGRLGHLRPGYIKFVEAAAMFGNTNSLPIALIQGLAYSKVGQSLWQDGNDSAERVAARGISYILFYAIFGNILRWSYGYKLLTPKIALPDDIDQTRIDATLSGVRNSGSREVGAETVPASPLSTDNEEYVRSIPRAHGHSNSHSQPSTLIQDDASDSSESLVDDDDTTQAEVTFFKPIDRTTSRRSPSNRGLRPPSERTQNLLNPWSQYDISDTDSMYKQHVITPTLQPRTSLTSFPAVELDRIGESDAHKKMNTMKRHLLRTVSTIGQKIEPLSRYITPPLYAAGAALIVGLIPSLQDFLFNPSSIVYPSLTKAFESCGSAAVPIILICLGAQMSDFLVRRQEQKACGLSEDQKMGKRAAIITVCARMVVIPLFVFPLVAAFVQWGDVLSSIVTDPVFGVTMIILGCAPTAINLIQICQVNGIYEDEMARVLVISYGILSIPCLVVVVMGALWVIQQVV
ncbi:hypothetical protein BZG36_03352 [Bifiguratus adelaidae]|uniref:Transporter n=1 Tax=Bifiguratus adelaidae TaxID=1938954 RepID=A0A261XWP2_9FUNG|nr:hypothetical protein BZG36_03352 [Bifiguratus adelaidae]